MKNKPLAEDVRHYPFKKDNFPFRSRNNQLLINKTFSGSHYASTCLDAKIVFNFLNVAFSSGPHFQIVDFLVNSINGAAICEYPLMKQRQEFAKPRNNRIPFTLIEACYSKIPLTFSGSIVMLFLALIMNPMYLNSLHRTSHFSISKYSPPLSKFFEDTT